jgi:ABC-2 type transport system ATP-binding protein
VLDEVERFGSRIIVIAQGRLVAEGPFAAIRDLMDDRPRVLRVKTDRPRQLAAGLLAAGVALGARVQSDRPDGDRGTGGDGLDLEGAPQGTIQVETDRPAEFRRAVAVVARDCDARLTEVVALDEDLESVFDYLVGRR